MLLSGSDVAMGILKELVNKRVEMNSNPTLGIVRVGAKNNDLAYERNILKKFSDLNLSLKVFNLPDDISQNKFDAKFDEVNANPEIHGILLFRPLPENLSDKHAREVINPVKDIDCMGYVNIAKLFSGEPGGYAPCTAAAAMKILDHYKIDLAGKNIAVLGRSMVIGRPIASMLVTRSATVTVCHSQTIGLKEICQNSDVIISAIGRPKFITSDFVNERSVIIDVGINTDEDGKLCGDVDFEDVSEKVAAITPVPGGVGAVTTSILALNVLKACLNS